MTCPDCGLALCEHYEKRVVRLEAMVAALTATNKVTTDAVRKTEQRLHGLVAAFILDRDADGSQLNKEKVLEMLREANRWLVEVLPAPES